MWAAVVLLRPPCAYAFVEEPLSHRDISHLSVARQPVTRQGVMITGVADRRNEADMSPSRLTVLPPQTASHHSHSIRDPFVSATITPPRWFPQHHKVHADTHTAVHTFLHFQTLHFFISQTGLRF